MEGFTIDEGPIGKRLMFDGAWNDRVRRAAQEAKVIQVSLAPPFGHAVENVDFLEELDGIIALTLVTHKLEDTRGLYYAKGLKYLSLPSQLRQAIDLGYFKDLKYFCAEYSKEIDSFVECKSLRGLRIDRYPDDDLRRLKPLRLLCFTANEYPKFVTLDGIEEQQELSLFSFGFARRLKDVSAISKVPSLEEFDCGSSRIGNIEWASELKNLQRLRLESVGDIPSLKPLCSCGDLEYLEFSVNCNVLDGQISFLTALPKLVHAGYRNRKHYDIKREEINEILHARPRSERLSQVMWPAKRIIES